MNAWSDRKVQISDYYTNLFQQYGDNCRSLDYGIPESQATKFKVLTSNISSDSKTTLLDVGCGLAHYAHFLSTVRPLLSYTGVDLCNDLIKRALEIDPSLDLHVLDILNDDLPSPSYDYVCANGIFYLLGSDADELMFSLISRMYNLADKTLIFNSLSSWCIDKTQGEFYADPGKVLDFCRTLSPWLSLRHDYHNRDFTIVVNKSPIR